jgi:hypothetical protein
MNNNANKKKKEGSWKFTGVDVKKILFANIL